MKTTHYPPSTGTGLTKCCGKTLAELGSGFRLASDPGKVTCGGSK